MRSWVAQNKTVPIEIIASHRIGWDGMGWDGMGWDGMRCDAMRCDAMRCDAMRCQGEGSAGAKEDVHLGNRDHASQRLG